ncbi:MAG: GAF domain-containing protein, partial [Vicingaceae bacterium]
PSQGLPQEVLEMVSNLSNAAALLQQHLNFHWTGFYLVSGNELVLGPFQGPVACTKIAKGKGVCGSAWELKKTLVVADVHNFPGHIACSPLSRSEIVVPFYNNSGEVLGVLDIDSHLLDDFGDSDQEYLEKFCEILSRKLVK